MTLDYEPLGNSKKIPAYTQKCIGELDEMPSILGLQPDKKVFLNAKYIGKNDYAGIANTYWVYTDNEKVKISCSRSKDEVYVGDTVQGVNETLISYFTIVTPEDPTDCEEFTIRFESSCGITKFVYKYQK